MTDVSNGEREQTPAPYFLEDFEYDIVPNYWRKVCRPRREKKNLPILNGEIFQSLLEGKTISVKINPNTIRAFKNLYATFYTRGYQLRMYQHETGRREHTTNRLFLWLERNGN